MVEYCFFLKVEKIGKQEKEKKTFLLQKNDNINSFLLFSQAKKFNAVQ